MSALIRNDRIDTDDFTSLEDDEAPPASGSIIVSLARWQKECEDLKSSGLIVGVRIPNTADLVQLWPLLAERPLIALEFPGFADGRAYSQARLLHDRYRYSGEVRATGAAVVRDQIQGMRRCGINAFALRADQDAEQCLTAFKDFSLAYQGAADDAQPIYRRRSA